MQTTIALPDSHRVAQCSTKSAAIFVEAIVGGDDLVILAEQLIE
jgi:hypothetical protein